ncbi:CcmD family protein [Armatimonas sp.]
MNMAFLLLVAVVIWVGVFAFVWMLDKKASSLEKRMARLENKQ